MERVNKQEKPMFPTQLGANYHGVPWRLIGEEKTGSLQIPLNDNAENAAKG
jgi:hypothetical protein